MENNWKLQRLSGVDLDEICRLCLSSEGIMSSIFSTKPGHRLNNLPNTIREITSVKVGKEDGLPSQICHSCLYNLERLSEFIQHCMESDQVLKEYLCSNKLEGEKRQQEDEKPEFNFVTSEDVEDSDHQSCSNENPLQDMPEDAESSFELTENEIATPENRMQNGGPGIGEDEESITQRPFSIDLWGLQNEAEEDNVESMVMVVDPSSQPMDDRCSESESETDRDINNFEPTWEVNEECKIYNFNCTTCNKSFMNEEQLGRHYLIHTQEAPFPCDFCDQEFEERSLLKKHWRVHAANKPYICFTCGDAFLEREQLSQHHQIHDYIKPFHCSICGKAFGYKSDLRKHAVIHSGIRPYICKTCGKSFTRSTNLNKHTRVHSGRRPFECEHCKKMFASRGDLSRHVVIHTGEKPYSCTVCELAFNRKDKLSRHEKLHAGERAFSCTECPTSFHRKEELTKHVQFHHFKPDPDPDYVCSVKRPPKRLAARKNVFATDHSSEVTD